MGSAGDNKLKKKSIAAHQPYLFPYLGYFQIINSVEKFILMGDLQHINRGWVNRNIIQPPGQESTYFTFPIGHGKHFAPIYENHYVQFEQKKKKYLKTMIQYHKSKNFDEAYNLVETIFECTSDNVADFNEFSILKICEYLNIKTDIIISEKNDDSIYRKKIQELEKTERAWYICRYYNCCHMVNAYGGIKLYDKALFREKGIELQFIKTNLTGRDTLSVIDYLMNHTRDEAIQALQDYTLI